jgi:hypothetical protein
MSAATVVLFPLTLASNVFVAPHIRRNLQPAAGQGRPFLVRESRGLRGWVTIATWRCEPRL